MRVKRAKRERVWEIGDREIEARDIGIEARLREIEAKERFERGRGRRLERYERESGDGRMGERGEEGRTGRLLLSQLCHASDLLPQLL